MERLENLINVLSANLIEGAVSLKVTTYYFDYSYQYELIWKGQDGSIIQHSLDRKRRKEIIMATSAYVGTIVVRDKNQKGYWNLCAVDLSSDGSYSVNCSYMPELDVKTEQEIIDLLGQDLYDKYQQEDRQRREAAEHSPEESGAEAEKTPEPSVYTIPELLGFMVEELSQDIPSDWQQLKIVAEVFEEQGKQAVSTVYAHHTGDENWQAFSATNSLGPMNAVLKVQQLMQQDGQAWSRATLIFSSDGSVSIQSD